jgi:hypothetical protein
MSTDASADGSSGLTDGSLLGGRYRLGELLGVGSSAAVFAAVDVDAAADQPPLAVKVLHAHLCQDEVTLQAFLREGAAAATVQHPNVVRVYGRGTHEAGGLSVGWLALERIDGGNLAELVLARGRLAPHEAVEVMCGVLDGLGAIHAAGLVHRDVTPRNVLLASSGTESVARANVHIADLGLADVTGRTAIVGDRMVAGTPAFVSPEQVLGQPVGATADLYQVGALLYFLLVGEPPYPRDTTEQIIDAHLYAPPPVPSAYVREAAPLDRLVTRALSKRPAARFQSASEFKEALEAALQSARPSATTGAHMVQATAVLSAASSPVTYLPVAPVAPSSEPYRRRRSDSRAGIIAALVIGLLVLVPVLQTIVPGAATTAGLVQASATAIVTAVVPRLAGTLQDAQAALAAQGFVVGQVTTRDSAEVEGRLLEQHPEPGSLSPRGSAVDLVVASGRNAVPQLVRLTVAAATTQLKAAGLVAATGSLSPSSIVGGSNPAAGQVVRVGSAVTLLAAVATTSATPSPSPSSSTAPVDTTPSSSAPTPTGTTTPAPTGSASPSRTTAASASLGG